MRLGISMSFYQFLCEYFIISNCIKCRVFALLLFYTSLLYEIPVAIPVPMQSRNNRSQMYFHFILIDPSVCDTMDLFWLAIDYVMAYVRITKVYLHPTIYPVEFPFPLQILKKPYEQQSFDFL